MPRDAYACLLSLCKIVCRVSCVYNQHGSESLGGSFGKAFFKIPTFRKAMQSFGQRYSLFHESLLHRALEQQLGTALNIANKIPHLSKVPEVKHNTEVLCCSLVEM